MLGLFGTLSMANRALQTQRSGTEVAGHNLANVNTPGYSRQRLAIETSFAIPTPIGGVPFQLPYQQDTLPLIIPGPHVASTSVPTRNVRVAAAATARAGSGAGVIPTVSSASKVENPSASARCALAIQSSADRS